MHITKQLAEAIDNYLNNTATAHEQKLVNEWYCSFNDETVAVPADSVNIKAAIEQRLKNRLDQTIREPDLRVNDHPVRLRSRKVLIAAAAVVIACVSSLFWLMQDKKIAAPMLTIHTATGELKEIVLADGSHVWLNAMSTLRYPQQFSGAKREVTLEGEAFFDISKNEQSQFVVHAGKTTTTVLGTAFNIAAYEPDVNIVVSVMRGKVQVSDAAATSGVLTKGQQVHYNPATREMHHETIAVTDKALWTEGLLVFDETPLLSITAALSRWYNVAFAFDNEQLKYCKYTATFNKEMHLPELLNLFSNFNNITYKISEDGTKVMLYGKGCQ